MIKKHCQRREIIKKLVGEGKIPKVRLIDGRVAEVKKGQVIELFVHDRTQKWIRSRVAEVFEDELGNRYYITEYHIHHIQREKHWKKLVQLGIKDRKTLLSWLRRIIKRPQVIIWDIRENALYLGIKKKKEVVLLSLVGMDTLKVMTAFPKKHIFKNRTRFKLMFSEIEEWR